MSEKLNKGSVFAFVLTLILIAALTIIKCTNLDIGFPSKDNAPNQYIARLYVSGTIEKENGSYNQKWLLETLDTLMTDPKNVGLILDINSPGGSIFETDEAYFKLMDYRMSKPIYTYVENLAASGAYYMACATDYIVANRNSLTGCIGVIYGESIDITGLLERYGVKVKTFHSGRNKLMGSLFEPLTEEQEEIFQAISDEAYDQFISVVAKGRNMADSTTIGLSDGRVYTAKQALKNRIIDRIGTFEDTKKCMENKFFGGDEIEIQEYKYIPPYSFLDSIMPGLTTFGKAKSTTTDLPESIQNAINLASKGPSYLYLGF